MTPMLRGRLCKVSGLATPRQSRRVVGQSTSRARCLLLVGGAGRVELASRVPESLRAMLETGRGLLRDPAKVQHFFESTEDNLRYLDPKLTRPGCDFGRASSELFEAGVAEVTREEPKEEIGLLSRSARATSYA